MSEKKPLLLFTGLGADGHFNPLAQIAEGMIKRGYDIVFVTSNEFADKVRKMGAEWVETLSPVVCFTPEFFQEMGKLERGLGSIVYAHKTIFLEPMPKKVQIIQDTLEMLREREPNRQIIVVEEVCSMSINPFKLGRAPPKGFDKFPKVIGVNVIPLWIKSRDTAPFTLGELPDSSEEGRQRNEELWKKAMAAELGTYLEIEHKCLKEAGATKLPEVPLDCWITSKDVCFQMCVPSLEYPRSDQPSSVRFAGCLPQKTLDPSYVFPDWWPEVVNNKDKKIVFVAQGTVAMNHAELVIPTISGLADREDILVVAALGRRGATLPEDFKLPPNALVADYLPYDSILQHADVFVSNGGYGSMTHSVIHGVPSVLAGETEDKVEVSRRAERAGLAFNLRTQTPSSEAVVKGINSILTDPKYKEAALKVKSEAETYDPIGTIAKQILDFTA